jgi:transketolase
VTVEDQNIAGGLGGAVCEVLMDNGVGNIKMRRLGLMDTFTQGYGTFEDLKRMNRLSKDRIADEVMKILKE